MTRSEYLTSNRCWYLEDATVSANIEGQQFNGKVSPFLPACIEDNSIAFHTDGSITINDRHVKCNETDPEQYILPGSWTLVDDATRLRAVIPGFPENIDFEILQLDGRYLRLKWYDTYMNTPSTFEARFSHKH